MKIVERLLSLLPSVNLSITKQKCMSTFRHLYSPLTKRPPPPPPPASLPPCKLRKLAHSEFHSLKECSAVAQQHQSVDEDDGKARSSGSNHFDMGNAFNRKDVLQRVFAFIDEDCDGLLSLEEIQVFLHEKMDISVSSEELQALVSCNNNGKMDIGSSSSSSFMDLGLFESILTGGSGIIGHVREGEKEEEEETDVKGSFRVFDLDGDGFISAKELQSSLARMGFVQEMEACQTIITALDLDGNGLLDFSEFNQMMNAFKDPSSSSPSSSSSSPCCSS